MNDPTCSTDNVSWRGAVDESTFLQSLGLQLDEPTTKESNVVQWQDSVSTSPVRSQARGSSNQDAVSLAEADGGAPSESQEPPPSPGSAGSTPAVSPLKRTLSRIRTHSPASPSRLKPGAAPWLFEQEHALKAGRVTCWQGSSSVGLRSHAALRQGASSAFRHSTLRSGVANSSRASASMACKINVNAGSAHQVPTLTGTQAQADHRPLRQLLFAGCRLQVASRLKQVAPEHAT